MFGGRDKLLTESAATAFFIEGGAKRAMDDLEIGKVLKGMKAKSANDAVG
jgi:hypothetical protein